MKYQIVYQGEIIFTAYDEQIASCVLKEYRTAFNSNDVYIRVVH